MTGYNGGNNFIFFQDFHRSDTARQNCRLCIIGQAQLFFRAFEAKVRHGKAKGFVSFLENVLYDTVIIIKVFHHPYFLGTLTREHERNLTHFLASSVFCHLMTRDPYVSPAPKPTRTTISSRFKRPWSRASHRAIGMDAADVLAY